MGDARHSTLAAIYHAEGWFLVFSSIRRLAIALLCANLWASSPLAFALPYGEGTVQDAMLATSKRLSPKKLHKLLVGEWIVRAPDAIRRQVRILEISVDPTSKLSDLDALNPTDEEILTFEGFQTLLDKNPDGPELLEAKSRIEALNNNQIVFTDETSILRVAGSERERSYRVIGTSPNLIRIFWIEANETNECVFIDPDHIRIFANNEEKVRLERD